MYTRRPPKKGFFSYFIPFFLLVLILGGGLYFLFRSGSTLFAGSAPAYVQVSAPSVEVLLKNTTEWKNIPDNMRIKLFAGDQVRTVGSGEGRLSLLGESLVYLGEGSAAVLDTLETSDSVQSTKLTVKSGKILASVERMLNPKSSFHLVLDDIILSSRGGDFILDGNVLQVLKGSVAVERANATEGTNVQEVGLGQQLILTKPANAPFAELTPLNSAVYASPWVEMALGKKVALPKSTLPVTDEPIVPTPISLQNSESSTPNDTAKSPATVKQDKDKTESAKREVKVTSTKEVSAGTFEVKGSVSAGAKSISIDDHVLGLFKSGDTSWFYRAKESLGNLKEGKNTYMVKAQFLDGSSAETTFTISYTKTTASAETVSSASQTSTALALLSPQNNSSTAEKSITLRGTTPENTYKIVVNDYTLKSYTPGDVQWKYNASSDYGNFTLGTANTFVVTAYDKSGKSLGSLNVVITSSLTSSDTLKTSAQ